MPDTVSEIVVIGYRPPEWPTTGIPPGSIAFEDGYYGIWKFLPDGTPNDDYPTSATEPVIAWDINPNTPESQALVLLIGNALVRLQQKIQVLPDNTTISIKAGTVYGTHVKSALQDVTTYPIKIVYTGAIPNAVGGQQQVAVIMEGSPLHPVIYVTPSVMAPGNYGDPSAFPNDSGINFVLLHEMAHVMTPVTTQTNEAYFQYLIRTGAGNLDHFNDLDANGRFIHPEPAQIENYANNAAIVLGTYFGLPVYLTPVYGS